MAAAPVTVHVLAAQGTGEIAIPVEVSVHNGTAQVTVQLRIALNLKLTS
jgi:hypothetical protein